MPRWGPDGAERLQAAALELFAEQGFERTTVAQIAERAGLTQRTFFNHFADKREVLFGLGPELEQRVVDEIGRCADTVPPLEAVVSALQVAADAMFEERRDAVARRRRLVEANPELQERELSKQAALTDAVAAALRVRGLDPGAALLTASAAMVVQSAAVRAWTQPGQDGPLREHLSHALQALRSAVSRGSGRRASVRA